MLKDGQAVMRLKIYEKKATQNKPVKAETKQTNKNLGFLGNGITHARTSLHAQARLCVHKSLPRKTKNIENKAQKIKKKKKKNLILTT